jgi:AcrR family transcriptional regulator
VAGKDVDPLIGIVVDMLDTEGYDAVQLREVARRARMSLATIYRRYPTRDALIVAALRWWMDANRYAAVSAPAPRDESLYGGLMRIFRSIFEPWEQHPQMLRAYVRAQSGPGGDELTQHGFDVVVPAAEAVLRGCDADFAGDMGAVLSSVIYGALSRFAAGILDITDVVPTIDRAVFWLAKAHDAVAR